MSDIRTVTVRAPVNIAVIKYWGKANESLIIPINDSLSGTLSMDEMCAKTTVAISRTFSGNSMWLNGIQVDISLNVRLVRCIQEVRRMVGTAVWPEEAHLRICSANNFPTAAGLASSAAGYACLMYALCQLFDISDTSKISTLARLGSGSACRSVYGGIVQWIAGKDHETSIARQILREDEWPQMRILVCVVSDHKKETSSTSGMQLSVQTSELIQERARTIVPRRMERILKAVKERNFPQFAQITMQDSNQFHAICQDTWPPIRYMNDISWSVVSLIHAFNKRHSGDVAAYTFDAGPNACIYTTDKYIPELLALLQLTYAPSASQPLEVKGIQYAPATVQWLTPDLEQYRLSTARPGALKYIISTKLGPGPQVLTRALDETSLLKVDGSPKL